MSNKVMLIAQLPFLQQGNRSQHSQYLPSNIPPRVCDTEMLTLVRCRHLIPFLISIDARSPAASTRSFTPIKAVGDGSFGTVWLCDWHGPLPANTPMSAMQSVARTKPEYANMHLVAVKRMKKRWEGGWDECKKLKEIEVRIHCLLFLPHYIFFSLI